MITKVYGHVDGVEVIFTPSFDGSTWSCTVPRDADGEYIVDLYAVNDTGVVSYYATVLFAVKGVEVSVKWLNYRVTAHMSRYTVTARMLSNTGPQNSGKGGATMPLEMYLGEVRIIDFAVTALNNQPFTLRNPSYELTCGDTVVAAGVPDMKDNTLTVTVEPRAAGYYLLALRFEVAGEVIVSKQNLVVKE